MKLDLRIPGRLQQSARRGGLLIRHLQHQQAAGFQTARRIGHDASYEIEPILAAVQREVWLVSNDARLGPRITIGDVRQVGSDHVKALSRNGCEQIGLDEIDLNAYKRGVLSSQRERIG